MHSAPRDTPAASVSFGSPSRPVQPARSKDFTQCAVFCSRRTLEQRPGRSPGCESSTSSVQARIVPQRLVFYTVLSVLVSLKLRSCSKLGEAPISLGERSSNLTSRMPATHETGPRPNVRGQCDTEFAALICGLAAVPASSNERELLGAARYAS